MGLISRMVRANLLDVLNQDYVLLARAKGAHESRVLVRHALRNALIPTVTIFGFSFAYLITRVVLTETIIALPGVGCYAVDSARSLDYQAIIGVSILWRRLISTDQCVDGPYLCADRSAHSAWRKHMTTIAVRLPVRWSRPAWITAPVVAGSILVVAWVAIALTASWWAPYDPLAMVGRRLQPPSARFWFGTDALGRDVFSRTMYGAAYSIPIAVIVVIVSGLFGSALGALAGFLGGAADAVVMRAVDVTQSMPPILLAMAVTASSVPGCRTPPSRSSSCGGRSTRGSCART